MKVFKFWSLLCFLCLGFAFTSCEEKGDDVDSGDSPVKEYVNEDGVNTGLKLYGIYDTYSSGGSGTAAIATMTLELVDVYNTYQKSKDISGWKTGFVTGVAMGKFGLQDEAQVTQDMYNEVSGIIGIFDNGFTFNTAIEAMTAIQAILG